MKRRETEKDLIGSCGLYCGLCPKYQSRAPSRCIGCKLGEQHSWCSIWNCCVKKHGLEICAACSEMPDCQILARRKVVEWIPAADNLRQIKEAGLMNWLGEQRQRQRRLEDLLRNYNEGRSMSCYCKACSRMPIGLIDKAIKEAEKGIVGEGIDDSNMRSRAKLLKSIIMDMAVGFHIDMG